MRLPNHVLEDIEKQFNQASGMLPVNARYLEAQDTTVLYDTNNMAMADLLGNEITPFDRYMVTMMNMGPYLIGELKRYRSMFCEEHDECKADPEMSILCKKSGIASGIDGQGRPVKKDKEDGRKEEVREKDPQEAAAPEGDVDRVRPARRAGVRNRSRG